MHGHALGAAGALEAAATLLNAVSDELGESIATLDLALKRLNLGISTWVPMAGRDDEGTGWFSWRELGYAKIGSKWGISLRTRSGFYDADDSGSYEEWLFNDAPRALRIEAVDKLPELLEGLTKAASTTTTKIKDKIGRAEQVVAAITPPPPVPVPRRKS